MTSVINATYDGKVFRPETPVDLKPDTHVRITVEIASPGMEKKSSFLQTAKALRLSGPPDWSRNLDDYLYRKKFGNEE